MRLIKFTRLFWLVMSVLCLDQHLVHGQKLHLRNGIVANPPPLGNLRNGKVVRKSNFDQLGRVVIIQFNSIPTQSVVQELKQVGIEILDYIPDNAYITVLNEEPNVELLKSLNVTSIFELDPIRKIQPQLLNGTFPSYMLSVPGKVDVMLSYPRLFSIEDIRSSLEKNQFEIVSENLIDYQFLEVRLDTTRLRELAELPWIQFIEEIAAPTELLTDKSKAGTRANMLFGSGINSKLDGRGVVIGIGDVGDPSLHIDLKDRMLRHPTLYTDWHGVHVAGIAAGAGISNEKFVGYAPRASILMRTNDEIWQQATTYSRDFGMVITNNSYGSGYGGAVCPGFGKYSGHSRILDTQAHDLPHLQHIFAAGNSGAAVACNGFPARFGNVQGDYASAKNVLSTGQTLVNGLISATSSKGPVQDGRIKPELVTPGTSISSSFPINKYGSATGTSMSSPAVAGGAALLYQQYRELHDQKNPKNALIKALLCNGATDKGLPGPDFTYGFGMMNLLRSSQMLKKGAYFVGNQENGDIKEFQVQIPAGISKAKIMLYWNDAATSTVAGGIALVNNLDLKVKTPLGASILPLSPDATNVNAVAMTKVDSINNVEQVVMENPTPGNYTFQVTGTAVPLGPQEFFLVYDLIEESVVLTYPAGSERLTSGDVININWDSYGHPTSKFAVSYSLNNGASWTNINSAVAATTNQLSWTVPATTTVSAKIRLVQIETGVIKESDTFVIMAVPVISLAQVQCEGYIAVEWTAVNGATDYEVMQLKDGDMKSVSITNERKFTFSALSRDTSYYISVRPRINEIPGRRAVAIGRQPNTGTCEGAISDSDLGIISIVSPTQSGRELTASSLSASQPVKFSIQNFDDQPINKSFEVGYSIGGENAPIHWETVRRVISPQSTYDHTFNKLADLHNVGVYEFNFFVKLDGDIVSTNNQKSMVIRQLPNTPLTIPYREDFEAMPIQSLRVDQMGLENADRYDFISPTIIGRLRTSPEIGHAYSGRKALLFDSDSWRNEGYTNLIGTYNLNGLNVNADELLFKFRFRQYGNYQYYGDVGIYIRGSDADSWIFVSDYREREYLKQDNNYYLKTISVSDLLREYSQGFSTSFQVMWRHKAAYTAQTDGLIIDDIQLVKASSDIAMIEVMPLSMPVCSQNVHQIGVRVKNLGNEDSFYVPFEVSVDGGRLHSYFVPVVRAGSDTLVTFFMNINLQEIGMHIIRATVNKSYDLQPDNNVTQLQFTTPPPITTFPYFEDFENGPGGWQTMGENSAWQFGNPNSSKVKGAASGLNAWKTNLTGPYQNEGTSYLYSPCFNLAPSGRRNIMLSFNSSLDMDPCADGDCDVVYVEYSHGGNWMLLPGWNRNTNWYTTNAGNSLSWNAQDYTRWHVSSTLAIPATGDYIRFRFVIKGNSSTSREGFAIDDVHLYDIDPIYDFKNEITGQGTTDVALFRDQVDGDEWVRFDDDYSLMAEIKPNNQNLGQVNISAYKNASPTPLTNQEYYLPRSFRIQASKESYAEPIGVRLFFKDIEIEGLIAAEGNTGFTKPSSVYDLSLTKYSGNNEDESLANNGESTWSHYPRQKIKIVPFMDGYFAEFETKSFSEFWLAKNYIGSGKALPVTMVSFMAKRQTEGVEKKESVLLEWQTSDEKFFSHFEIEVAHKREGLQQMMFEKVGEVAANGASVKAYTFKDNSQFVSATRYYRLKLVDTDGSFQYSNIRSVHLNVEKEWKIFPNPVKETMSVQFEEKPGLLVKCSILDVNGHTLHTEEFTSDGTVQQKAISASFKNYLPGVYLFKIVSDDRQKVFKFVKE